ncbi:MAG: hypothetical protein JWM59_4191 [Verrucomicrobiales bacterium]|nr:hypothetical protein [Verrucomicrobiales bacterium]
MPFPLSPGNRRSSALLNPAVRFLCVPGGGLSSWRRRAPAQAAAVMLLILAGAAAPAVAADAETTATPVLSAGKEGGLLRNGKPWRGLGVNYYDAFARLLGDGKAGDVEAGFRALADAKIPFVRFSACGYWPADWSLYRTDREEYFRRLDTVVRCAEKNGIGVIPSLFWHQPTVSDLVGEALQEWGNPASKTIAFMRAYTKETVTRLRGSKTVWAWEFGNEFNLPADLPNAAEHRAPVAPALGTAAARSERDDLRHADIRTALTEFSQEVRRHDPHRLILSGNAFPRVSAWHQMHRRTWDRDSAAQRLEMLDRDNPPLISTLTGRIYAASDLEFLPAAAAEARRAGTPLFIGEFGVPGAPTEESRQQFRSQLEALDQNRVPLAALWVFDFKGQDADWNVTTANIRAELLRLVSETNARWQAE